MAKRIIDAIEASAGCDRTKQFAVALVERVIDGVESAEVSDSDGKLSLKWSAGEMLFSATIGPEEALVSVWSENEVENGVEFVLKATDLVANARAGQGGV